MPTTYTDNFNDGIRDNVNWTYEGVGGRGEPGSPGYSVEEHSGYLDFRMDVTDDGGAGYLHLPTGFTSGTLDLRAMFHAESHPEYAYPYGTYFYYGGFQLQFESAEATTSVSFNMFQADYQQVYSPRFSASSLGSDGVLTDQGMVEANVLSSSMMDRWLDMSFGFDVETGQIWADLEGDGITDMSMFVDMPLDSVLNTIYFQSFGWWQGHFMRLDDLTLTGDATAPVPRWNLSSLSSADTMTFALLANDSYNGDEDGEATLFALTPPDGWKVLLTTYDNEGARPTDADGNLVRVTPTVVAPGMQATAYIEESTGRVVIAYRGTDVGGPHNELVETSLSVGLGLRDNDLPLLHSNSESYIEQARLFYQAVINETGTAANSISFTGHSLGAMVAGYMAGITGQQAMLFDSGPHTEIVQSLDELYGRPVGYGYLPPEQTDFSQVYHTRVNGEILGGAVDIARETVNVLDLFLEYFLHKIKIVNVVGTAINPFAMISAQALEALVSAMAERWGDAVVEANQLPELLAAADGLIDGFAAGLRPSQLHSMSLAGALLYGTHQAGFDRYTEMPGLISGMMDDDLAKSVGAVTGFGYSADTMLSALLRTTVGHLNNPLVAALSDAQMIGLKINAFKDSFGLNNLPVNLMGELTGDNLLPSISKIFIEAAYRDATSTSITYGLDSFDLAGAWTTLNLAALGGGAWAGVSDIRTAIQAAFLDDLNLGETFKVIDRLIFSANTTSKKQGAGSAGSDMMIGALRGDNTGVEMHGNGGADLLYGTSAGDTLQGGTGLGVLVGGKGNDMLVGGVDGDYLLGGDNDDTLIAWGAKDRLFGGSGKDQLYGGAGNDTLTGGLGRDSIYGDADNDTVLVGAGESKNGEIIDGGAGRDTIATRGVVELHQTDIVSIEALSFQDPGAGSQSEAYFNSDQFGSGRLTLDLKVTGSAADDSLQIYLVDENFSAAGFTFGNWASVDMVKLMGNSLENMIIGSSSQDLIDGGGDDDELSGGKGNDTLIGGGGQDMLAGGAGKDVFYFKRTNESKTRDDTADVIKDFIQGQDRIDLSSIDAFTLNGSTDDAFVFRGTAAFSMLTAGEVRYEKVDQAGTANDHTMVFIDTNTTGGAEMAIRLTGLYTLTAADFIL